RAALLTALGWNVINITDGRDEPLSLGEQATTLLQGMESIEALVAKANAQSLVAECTKNTNPARSAEAARSALSLFERAVDTCQDPDRKMLYGIHLEAARLNCLLGRTEEATLQCKQAQQLAPDEGQRLICMTELGTIYRNEGRLPEAREMFARATKSPGVAPY